MTTSSVTARIPTGVWTSLCQIGEQLRMPVDHLLVAAHGKVLAVLSGEDLVPGSWRGLLTSTDQRAADPTGVAFSCELVADGTPATIRIRFSSDEFGEAAADRILGYHVTALEQMATDLDADHTRVSLVGRGELRYQLDDLAGPVRPLPDLRAHQVFEQQAALRPDDIAVVHGAEQWTYAELDRRANRLAHALLEQGLHPEDVVAVATERTRGWVAGVLAVLKAGGVYLPVEPHFPAARIATMLTRSGCRLALTEAGGGALGEALTSMPDVTEIPIERVAEPNDRGDSRDRSPGVTVGAGQAAYIYFTSGSTGEPKGALCQHDGLLNHLLAKIEDLGIAEDQVVAQTAPQCFDISLWQALAGLLVGGRTLLVGQDEILDVARFVDRIADGRVAVLQVVPSYLEAVLAQLERHPRSLPALRCVSVTGEALPVALAQRWFAVLPDVPLVNAYGLTETSDDTNHEILTAAPVGDRVPVGRPVRNVQVYVVDDHLAPVPLGAPGEIVFAGVCVGRGYVNDPERTRAAFVEDPYHPGQRLYRSGDRGRWLPDGRLEFLGRRDSQVKLNGFRIEIGEIESVLAGLPGVTQAAVVVADRHLVAFHTGSREPDSAELADILPAYLVPAVRHWLPSLPLTDNGKVDRKALLALAATLATTPSDGADRVPRTPEERRLAAAWAEILGIAPNSVGVGDHFFDQGGTSLAAVRLVIALDRAVSLRTVTGHPVLADLARQLPPTTER